MKTLLSLIIALLCCVAVSAAEEPDKRPTTGLIAVGRHVGQIPETDLWKTDIYYSQKETSWSEHQLIIGCHKEGLKIVPFLTFPSLYNDTYEVKVADGILKVVSSKGKRLILSIDLRSISLALITKPNKSLGEE